MPVPAVAGHGIDLVHLEDRGVVDEAGDRAECRLRSSDEWCHLGFLAKIGLQQDNTPAERFDLGTGLRGLVARLVIVDRHVPAIGGEFQRDGAAEAPRAAGNKNHAFCRCARHGIRAVPC